MAPTRRQAQAQAAAAAGATRAAGGAEEAKVEAVEETSALHGGQTVEQTLTAQLKAMSAKVERLDQQLAAAKDDLKNGAGGKQPKDYSNYICNHCKKKGHIKQHCPQLKNNGKQDGNKWAAPKDGEPQEKVVDGVKRFYCSKCKKGKGFWNTSHVTAQHRNRPPQTETPPPASGNVGAVDQDLLGFCQFISS